MRSAAARSSSVAVVGTTVRNTISRGISRHSVPSRRARSSCSSPRPPTGTSTRFALPIRQSSGARIIATSQSTSLISSSSWRSIFGVELAAGARRAGSRSGARRRSAGSRAHGSDAAVISASGAWPARVRRRQRLAHGLLRVGELRDRIAVAAASARGRSSAAARARTRVGASAFATSTIERAFFGFAIGSSTSGLLPRSWSSRGSSASADASAASARPLNSAK